MAISTRLTVVIAASCFLLLAGRVDAGGGPENLLLVVNRNDDSSLMIANYYIYWRKIPATNVLYLDDVPRQMLINYPDYKNKILLPILKYIEHNKLDGQIDYVIFSSGFPPAVAVPEHYKKLTERLEKENGPRAKEMFKIFFAQGSLTSLTYFAGPVLADEPIYMALDSNNYYRKPANAILEFPFGGKAKNEYDDARKQIESGKLDEGIDILKKMAEQNPAQLALAYSLAQGYARKQNWTETGNWLSRAIRLGWSYRDYTKSDPAFQKALSEPLISGIIEHIPDLPFEVAPTMSFSSRYAWGINGGVNGSNETGIRYLLSTMLGTTWNNGNSEEEILQYLKRSVEADGTHPEGTYYFTETTDVRTTTRQPNFAMAIQQLEKLGGQCEIVKAPLPKQGKVAGATLGVAKFDWYLANCEISPGAIVENLTSYGAKFDDNSQTKLTEPLKYGAAGSSGTVIEPFAIQNKFPHPMIHVHYRRGCTLAESFYQSLAGPFQLLIIGDPLCRPWADFVSLKTTPPPAPCSGKISIPVEVDHPDRLSGLEVFLDGHLTSRQNRVAEIQLDTTKITDGFHEIRVVAINKDLIQTRTSSIVQIQVNNQAQNVILKIDKKEYRLGEVVRCTVNSNCSEELVLFCNSMEVGRQAGNVAAVDIKSEVLGRGPITLYAVAVDKDNREHFSIPVQFEVTGEIRKVFDTVGTGK